MDKDLVQWVLPDFSTTTLTDTSVCAVLLMATLKSYVTLVSNIDIHLHCTDTLIMVAVLHAESLR